MFHGTLVLCVFCIFVCVCVSVFSFFYLMDGPIALKFVMYMINKSIFVVCYE